MAVPRRGVLYGLAALAAALGVPGCGRAAIPPRQPGTPAPVRVDYGPGSSQYGELHLPAGSGGGIPVVVVIHGGFWRSMYSADLGTPLAVDLANHGVAAWNIEYRRTEFLGDGGWPATFADVADALDALPGVVAAAAGGQLDLDRVVAVGHSAGGQLAGWLAGRRRLPADAPNAVVRQPLRGVISQAGVLDLVAADAANLGGGAVADLLGGTAAELPRRYQLASPAALVPLAIPVVCVHGTADGIVPFAQSAGFVRAALAVGGRAELVRLPGVDHFALIDPATEAWRRCREAALRLLA